MNRVFKIPNKDNERSYLISSEDKYYMHHRGKISKLPGRITNILGGSTLLETGSISFLIPGNNVNYSYTPTMLIDTTLVIPEINPQIANSIFEVFRSKMGSDKVTFKQSATFSGSMPGWIFGTGTLGTGYYKDTKLSR
jgi:hypothetical protein